MESIHARTTMLGLTKEQVDASYRQHGGNELESQKRAGFFAKLLANFGDPVIKILLLALAVNIIFLFRNQNWFETMGIAIAIALATLVSTISQNAGGCRAHRGARYAGRGAALPSHFPAGGG